LALVVGAAIALSVTVAVSPSYAAETPRTLPAGQTMFALSCDSSVSDLLSVDAATAVSTQVGTSTPTPRFCSVQPAWDAVTQTAYFLDETSNAFVLSKMNIATGVRTVGARFTLEGQPHNVDAIAISPSGVAFAVNAHMLYSLNLADATLTSIGLMGQAGFLYGLAFNSAGVLYGVTSSGYGPNASGKLYTVNTGTGESTLVTTLSFPSNADPANSSTYPLSIQFDSNGILWMMNYGDGPGVDLWSVDLTATDLSASAVRSGAFVVDGTYFYHQALLIVPFAVPVFTSAAEAAGTVGSAFTFTATTSGGAGTTFAITAGTLPAGLVLDAATGIISGTPTGAGTSTFTITASNMVGMTEQPFTLAIAAAAAVIHLPVVSG
jgi:hypothetical protein